MKEIHKIRSIIRFKLFLFKDSIKFNIMSQRIIFLIFINEAVY